MRAEYPTDDGVIGLVPLALQFTYEHDPPDEDIIGVIASTSLGRFVLWLPMPTAVGVANAIADIATDCPQLRARYLQNRTGPPPS